MSNGELGGSTTDADWNKPGNKLIALTNDPMQVQQLYCMASTTIICLLAIVY